MNFLGQAKQRQPLLLQRQLKQHFPKLDVAAAFLVHDEAMGEVTLRIVAIGMKQTKTRKKGKWAKVAQITDTFHQDVANQAVRAVMAIEQHKREEALAAKTKQREELEATPDEAHYKDPAKAKAAKSKKTKAVAELKA